MPKFLSHLAQTVFFALALALVIAAWLFVKRLPGLLRSRQASGWPVAQGMVESVDVKTMAEQALAEAAYSYVTEGERYSGYFVRQFANEQDAWKYVDKLKSQPICVRYNPERPSVSAIRVTDQSPLFSQTQHRFLGTLVMRHVQEAVGVSDLQHRWEKLGCSNWPIVKAHVESGRISQHHDTESWGLLPNYIAEVTFSYVVAGEYYSGYIERSFFREAAAQKFVEEMRGKEVFVRYKQDAPNVSLLRSQDQLQLT